jgi:hypothetical protein
VLDFRRKSRFHARQAIKRRRWLLWLAFLLGMTFLVVTITDKPHLWRLFDRWNDSSNRSDKSADNRLNNISRSPKDLDRFTIPAQQTETRRSAESAGEAKGYFPGVNPAQLEGIHDDKMSLSEDWVVARSWFNILKKTDPAAIRRASLGPIAYAQLAGQPRSYRGRLVAVSGVVRRAHRLEVYRSPGDPEGIDAYYQLWLYPIDNPRLPIVLYVLELPDGFPTGMEIAEEATATGFFLKRWLYAHGDTLLTAPTVLAKTLKWEKRVVVAQTAMPEGRTLIWILAGTMLAAALSAWCVFRHTKPSRRVLPDRPPDFSLLGRMDLHDDRES